LLSEIRPIVSLVTIQEQLKKICVPNLTLFSHELYFLTLEENPCPLEMGSVQAVSREYEKSHRFNARMGNCLTGGPCHLLGLSSKVHAALYV
jgi:hypothetical protein